MDPRSNPVVPGYRPVRFAKAMASGADQRLVARINDNSTP
jgi:hypothetical protein